MTLVDSRPGIVATLAGPRRRRPARRSRRRHARRAAPAQPRPRVRRALRRRRRRPLVRPLPRALRGARRARHRISCPGARESVAAVRELGGRAVVITAKYEPNARRCLDQVGLDVDAVFGWRYADGKGDTLRDEGAAVYVGDTPNDVRGRGARRRAHGRRSRRVRTRRRSCAPRARRRCSTRWCTSRSGCAVTRGASAPYARRRRRRPGHSSTTIAEHHEHDRDRHQDHPRACRAPTSTRRSGVALPGCALHHGRRRPGSSTFTLQPERVAEVGEQRLVDRVHVDAAGCEQRRHDVRVGGQPGLQVLRGRACRVAE